MSIKPATLNFCGFLSPFPNQDIPTIYPHSTQYTPRIKPVLSNNKRRQDAAAASIVIASAVKLLCSRQSAHGDAGFVAGFRARQELASCIPFAKAACACCKVWRSWCHRIGLELSNPCSFQETAASVGTAGNVRHLCSNVSIFIGSLVVLMAV